MKKLVMVKRESLETQRFHVQYKTERAQGIPSVLGQRETQETVDWRYPLHSLSY